MNGSPLVSIIMAARECGPSFSAALSSVAAQEYGDWELVLVDDGSSAPLLPAVESFRDSRMRVIRLEQNAGLAAALNLALGEARGRFVARMDADDVMEPCRIGTQLVGLLAGRWAFCGTGAIRFGSEHGKITAPATGQQIIDSFLVGNPFVHPTIMFDRVRCGSRLHYRPDFRCEEDYELWSRIISPDNCANLEEPLLKYRVSPQGNANHPAKARLNRIALDQFTARMGIARQAPTAILSEFQMSGFIDASGWRQLTDYAKAAEREGWPRLGFLQAPLLNIAGYEQFAAWLSDHQRLSVRLGAFPTFPTGGYA